MKMGVELNPENIYDAVGGRPWFDALVDRFFAGVATDPIVRRLYPDDLTDSKVNTAGFIAQYWGGPMSEYSEVRGHPRLRMRHAPFAIGQAERDAWLGHMVEAVRAGELRPDIEARMLEYFEAASAHLINQPE